MLQLLGFSQEFTWPLYLLLLIGLFVGFMRLDAQRETRRGVTQHRCDMVWRAVFRDGVDGGGALVTRVAQIEAGQNSMRAEIDNIQGARMRKSCKDGWSARLEYRGAKKRTWEELLRSMGKKEKEALVALFGNDSKAAGFTVETAQGMMDRHEVSKAAMVRFVKACGWRGEQVLTNAQRADASFLAQAVKFYCGWGRMPGGLQQ
mmetsp:Transcript_15937/g.39435  ORF Transcript_15937/g.39435 Transcript_15937/m.39435 type:complete len:204 (+) Transcript_15937:94-705(+)